MTFAAPNQSACFFAATPPAFAYSVKKWYAFHSGVRMFLIGSAKTLPSLSIGTGSVFIKPLPRMNRRTASAPNRSICSSGLTKLPSDFENFFLFSSTINPFTETVMNAGWSNKAVDRTISE